MISSKPTGRTISSSAWLVWLIGWLGDRELATFRSRWDTVVDSIKDKISDSTVADILAMKLGQSSELRDGMAHYYRMPEGHEDHTYKYLRDSIERFLARRQQKKNRKEQTRALSHTTGDKPRDSQGRNATLARDSSANAGRGEGARERQTT